MGSAKGYEHQCKLTALRALGLVSPPQRTEGGGRKHPARQVLGLKHLQSTIAGEQDTYKQDKNRSAHKCLQKDN